MDQVESGQEVYYQYTSRHRDGIDVGIYGFVDEVHDDGSVTMVEVHATCIWGNSQACAGKKHRVMVEDLISQRLASWAREKVSRV